MTLLVYSSLLLAVLVLGLPYWAVRMVVSGRYRAGLAERLGWLPGRLREACADRDVIWLHAVSVGEVLAATQLIAELQRALPGWVIAISTTTETGQRLAQERFATAPVFYLPIDLAVLMRRCLGVLRPRLVVLMESELWPNMIHQCQKAGVPLAVVNARVSDRSFPRYMRLRPVWRPLLREVTMFLAQSEETAGRLRTMGVAAERVTVAGNLKYDVLAPKKSRVAELIREAAAGRKILVAGSTLHGHPFDEDAMVIQAWESLRHGNEGVLLVLAPRHPSRFDLVYSVATEFPTLRATEMLAATHTNDSSAVLPRTGQTKLVEIVVLDTIGDLAAAYGVADVAFVGGSLVKRGGHSPLEPAQFGVPVVIGGSFENFRETVQAMKAAGGISIVCDQAALQAELARLLADPDEAQAMGERGRTVFKAQQGATARVVAALVALIR